MTYEFTVPGKARGKERPRFSGKTGKVYTPKNTKNYEELVKMKPDCDNILKSIADALNGIAYKDDSQVCGAYVEKRYDLFGDPRVCVEVKDAEV